MSDQVGLFVAIAAFILLIFLLSLILIAIDGPQAEQDWADTEDNRNPSNDTDHRGNQVLISTIAEAIHTYRRYRHSDEHNRARRERVTIVVLGLAAIFALFAAAAAFWSGVTLQAQLTETRDEQRPWIGPPLITVEVITGQLHFTQHFKNVGKSPTTGYIVDEVITSQKDYFWKRAADVLCANLRVLVKTDPRHTLLLSLVPGSDSIVPFGDTPTGKSANLNIDYVKTIPGPAIVGCVLYGNIFDELLHQTEFIAPIDITGRNATIRFSAAAEPD